MKKLITGLLKGRITRWGLLAGLLIAVGTYAGWTNQRQYQLGGTFIGSDGVGGGSIWSGLNIPLDPAGRTAALRVNQIAFSPGFVGLLQAFGADAITDAVGEERMISRDTARYGTVGAFLQGSPPTRVAIFLMYGTLKFTGPDNYQVTYTLDVYLPAADADGDGYPDPGATPVFSASGVNPAKRVPIP